MLQNTTQKKAMTKKQNSLYTLKVTQRNEINYSLITVNLCPGERSLSQYSCFFTLDFSIETGVFQHVWVLDLLFVVLLCFSSLTIVKIPGIQRTNTPYRYTVPLDAHTGFSVRTGNTLQL
jgi:hypothetical protein